MSNRPRADRYMAAAGVDAIVSWVPVGVRYLTGYWCWIAPLLKAYMVGSEGGEALAIRTIGVLPRGGEPSVILGTPWAPDALGADVADVRLTGDGDFELREPVPELHGERARVYDLIGRRDTTRSPFEVLAALLREQNLDGSRVAVDHLETHPIERDELRALLPRSELLDCTSLLRLVRAAKTGPEIDALSRAASTAESAALHALESARPGSSTADVVRLFRQSAAAAGADFDHFTFGPAGLGLMNEASVELRHGDALYVDFGLVDGGWFADSGTTLAVGEVSAEGARQHASVRDCVAAGAAELRPGLRGSTVQAAMRDALADAGITSAFPHGHGLGLEVRDYPLLMPDTGLTIRDGCVELAYDLELEEGMVVNLEAPVFTMGVRSVHCEQSYVITADGCRPLVVQDRRAPVVAADLSGPGDADRDERGRLHPARRSRS